MIDVCRGPVHIKKGAGTVDVIKKRINCSQSTKNEFCSEAKNLATIVQDDGLIFAKGIKEELESDHGKVFCSFLLLNKYLQDSVIFNNFDQYEDDLESLRVRNYDKTKSGSIDASSTSSPSSMAPRPVMEGESSKQESPAEEKATAGEGSF